jgi:hypothetical protein
MNKVAHDHNVYVSTGGWIENVDDAAPPNAMRHDFCTLE